MPIGVKWHTKMTAKQFYTRYNLYRYIIISVSIRSIWWPPFGTVIKIYYQDFLLILLLNQFFWLL
ncbi:hypothetical protein SSUR61_0884 [Streptococcus suis R61]|uniref:Uncharacterized protein n=1 Tax=Streptococcus suis R61 TaxID=996306 RepID=A0AA87K474_STRSU|nr:hypothetical protein SSUR61_0884 [Streptococcus suis R61]